MDRHTRIKRRLRLRDLDILLAVAQCGSMARAAIQLSISQPAISKVIGDMEHALGVRLFDRTSQGVEPTLYGQALLRSGVAVFDDLRQGVAEIDALADPATGEVRVAASDHIAAGLLTVVIGRLSKQYPRISVYTTQTAISALPARTPPYRDLRERNVDLVLGPIINPFADEALQAEPLFEDRLIVAAGTRNQWVRRRSVSLADLIDEPWVLPPLNTIIGGRCIDAFRQSGFQVPMATMTSTSSQVQLGLLSTGRFFTMFPHSLMVCSAKRLSITALPIELLVRSQPTGIITLKNRTISPVAQRFIECAREVARSLAKRS